jgi:hypothetical protein
MSTQKKTIKVLMFLLPAIVSLLAYTAYHEMLFRKPPCLINCDQPSMFSDNEKIKKWLAYLESLRDDTFNTKPNNKRTFPTPLDIAFLQDKINLASNDRDYLKRYQQIISDLTSPNVVKDETASEKGSGSLPDKVSQLAYLSEDMDPNNQVFANPSDDGDNKGSSPFNGPRTSPYYVPTGNGPVFYAGGSPNNNGGSSGGGDSNNGNPNNNGTPNGGTPGGNVTPTGPGGNGNTTPGGGNPISTVPVPGSGYLIAGVALAIGLLRLRVTERKHSLGYK